MLTTFVLKTHSKSHDLSEETTGHGQIGLRARCVTQRPGAPLDTSAAGKDTLIQINTKTHLSGYKTFQLHTSKAAPLGVRSLRNYSRILIIDTLGTTVTLFFLRYSYLDHPNSVEAAA